MFDHLRQQNMSYLQHLIFAWRMSFVLFVHGLIPNIWTTYVSDKICNNDHKVKVD